MYSIDGYAQLLSNISELPKENCLNLLQADMAERNHASVEGYFSDILITLRKVKSADKKKSKKAVDQYMPTIATLNKSAHGGILFHFEESLSHVLKGFTIDLRLYFNLLRKMVMIRLNHDKVWSRQFYSQDLKNIFMVLKPLDSVIHNRAMVEERSYIGGRLFEADRVGVHRPIISGAS